MREVSFENELKPRVEAVLHNVTLLITLNCSSTGISRLASIYRNELISHASRLYT